MGAHRTNNKKTRRADSFGDQQHDGREGERAKPRRSLDWSCLLPPDADNMKVTTNAPAE